MSDGALAILMSLVFIGSCIIILELLRRTAWFKRKAEEAEEDAECRRLWEQRIQHNEEKERLRPIIEELLLERDNNGDKMEYTPNREKEWTEFMQGNKWTEEQAAVLRLRQRPLPVINRIIGV